MKSLILRLLFAVVVLSLAATDVRAKEWQILATFSGRPAGSSFFTADNWEIFALDFDADGVQDMAMNKKEMAGPSLVVVSGANPNQRWQIPLSNGIIGILIAFMDFDGKAGSNGAVKEILLAQKVGQRFVNPVVLYNVDATAGIYEVRIWDQGTILIGGWDTDDDGIFELVIGDQNKNEVQVWGFR